MRWFASPICLGEAQRGNLANAKTGLENTVYVFSFCPSLSALVFWMWAVMAAHREELLVVMTNAASRCRIVYLLYWDQGHGDGAVV